MKTLVIANRAGRVEVPIARGTGLTARQIVANAPLAVKRRAVGVRITGIKTKATERGVSYTCSATTVQEPDGTRAQGKQPHEVRVVLTAPRNRYVIVDCDCGYHSMWGAEYNLNQRNAADIVRSDGSAPDVRDPTRKKIACKHAVAFLHKLISRNKV